MSSPAFKHFAKAQKEFKPPLIANENAYLGDIVSSTDSEKPISAGFYRLEKGTPLVYTYHYDEMKIIVEGEFDIKDETGQSVHVGSRTCGRGVNGSNMLTFATHRLSPVTSSISPRAAKSPSQPNRTVWVSTAVSARRVLLRYDNNPKAKNNYWLNTAMTI